MDPPEIQAAPTTQTRRSRRCSSVERALNFTICFAILSLLKLEPIARNSVPNDNSNINIDLPRQEEKEKPLPLKSIYDSSSIKNIQDSERLVQRNIISAQNNVGVGNDNAIFFCGNHKWKQTDISCDERVSYLVGRYRYDGSRFEARESLLEQNCACNASSSATINNYVNMTRMILAAEIAQPSTVLAPWDASEAIGGSELIKDACQEEIEQSQCHGKLPLYNCLIGYNIRSNKTIE